MKIIKLAGRGYAKVTTVGQRRGIARRVDGAGMFHSSKKAAPREEGAKPEASTAKRQNKRREYTPNMIAAARILCDNGFSNNAAAEVLGVTGITVSRWRKNGDKLINSKFYARKGGKEAAKHESAGGC